MSIFASIIWCRDGKCWDQDREASISQADCIGPEEDNNL